MNLDFGSIVNPEIRVTIKDTPTGKKVQFVAESENRRVMMTGDEVLITPGGDVRVFQSPGVDA